MKKITLSAAILALAMMGCSDAGLDNSVASTTSETQSEYKIKLDENPNFLAKGSFGGCDDYVSYGCGETVQIGKHKYSYAFATDVNARNQGYSALGLSVDNLDYAIPDYVHTYAVCVRGCNELGYCQEHTPIATNSLASYKVGSHSNDFLYTMCTPLVGGDRNSISVISTFAAVFNARKPDQFILQMSAHSSNLNQNQALLAYRHYMMNLD